MRPKVTFRVGKKIRRTSQYRASWIGEHATPRDAKLPEALQEILMKERAIRSFRVTPSADIQATLRALRPLRGHELRKAIEGVDRHTRAHLTTGALK